ncbi:MAG: hypothetical protein IJH43_08980 [Mogibacterium sp.]|nr:hypothetical protein [Mogibacterium sp.]
MIETRIYVGLNDSLTKKQIFETEKYISVLRNVCFAYNTPFSFDVEEGGYIHENGDYTLETTLVLILIDAEKDTIDNIAKDLCVFFHQESVLITESRIRSYYVKETLE